MSVTVKLRQPIQAHGETMRELTLREPRGKDIAACGAIRTFVQRGKATAVEINAAAVQEYIVLLGNIPPTSVDQLSASDWNEVQNAIMLFFAPTDGTGETSAGEGDNKAGDQATKKTVAIPFQDSTTQQNS